MGSIALAFGIALVWTFVWYSIYGALEAEGGFVMGVAAVFSMIGAIACVLLGILFLGSMFESCVDTPPEEWTYPGRGR